VGEGGDGADDVVQPEARAEGEVRRGPPLLGDRGLTFEATRPWEALGMSRRSWYRRRRSGAFMGPAVVKAEGSEVDGI
jgi:hypothetical protein